MSCNRARVALVLASAASVLVACAARDGNHDREGRAAAPLSFSEGNNSGYCASNPSAQCWQGTPLGYKQLALTLDDGPGSRTLEISAWLRDQGIQATFFVNGMHYGSDAASVIQQVIADGHLVGNHTQDHLDLTSLGDQQIIDELVETDDLIAPYVPNGHFVFRAPYGNWSSHDYAVLENSSMSKYVGPVRWDIGGQMTGSYAADWDCWQNTSGYGVMTTKQCGDRYLNEIRDVGRGIILVHDQDYGDSSNHSLTSGEGNTIDMVKYIVPILLSEGYSFVRVDDVPDISAALGGGSGGGGGGGGGGGTDAGTGGGGGGTCDFSPTWGQTTYANSWWVEYNISGDIASASFEVVGGATTNLSKSYDKWVGSPSAEVPAGTQVKVHARNSAGLSAVTQAFAYLRVTNPATDCGQAPPPPPPDSGTDAGGGTTDAGGGTTDAGGGGACFTPTWSQGDGANTWWVEYAISGSIKSAYLEVPGHGTVNLGDDGWGKWVGVSDFEIPAGTSVVVHATNTANATAKTTSFGYLNVTSPKSAACP